MERVAAQATNARTSYYYRDPSTSISAAALSDLGLMKHLKGEG